MGRNGKREGIREGRDEHNDRSVDGEKEGIREGRETRMTIDRSMVREKGLERGERRG